MLSGIPFKGSLRSRQGGAASPSDNRVTSSISLSRSDPESPCFDPDDSAVEPEDPELKELNHSLEVLTTVFPDVQAEVFREMLTSFSEDSRLEVVTEAMLRHPDKWIRGRHRTAATKEQQQKKGQWQQVEPAQEYGDLRGGILVLKEDKFRNEPYKTAVKDALYQEFKGLSHSTIRAVLAEHNYSYTGARPTLLGLASKSWRLSITSFFTRRKPPSPLEHPLVAWQRADPKRGALAVPRLIPTKNAELNRELYDTLVAPILAKQKAEQMEQDRALADELNDREAEEAGEMYDCECCFTPSSFEHMSACDTGSHWICFRCIRFTINEALYGQGWARSINPDRLTLVCIAPVGDGVSNCQGCIPTYSLQRALAEDKDGEATFRKMEERAASEALLKSQLPLIQCPFCAYAEVDDACLSSQCWKLKSQSIVVLSFISLTHFLYISILRLAFRFCLLFAFFFITLNYLLPTPYRLPLTEPLLASRTRIARKRRGLRFTCGAAHCGRSSCLQCSKPWRDPHVCHESALQSLRSHVENAVSDAVKRTCPQCNLSFVKSSGCNKLTCVCGYTMCYLCRARIGPEGYAHFCQHFRQHAGPCRECDRCDLYKVDDDDEEGLLRRAAERAEQEWRESKEGVGNEEVRLTGVAVGAGGGKELVGVKRTDEWGEWLDWALDALLA